MTSAEVSSLTADRAVPRMATINNSPIMVQKKLYHVTVLSNFARAFDKYSHGYSKVGVPESTYPDRFYLLDRHELGIGCHKASKLIERLAIPGNRLIVLETEVDQSLLRPNPVAGRGVFIDSAWIRLSAVYDLEIDAGEVVLRQTIVEEVMAASLRLSEHQFHKFADLRPRSVSILPVALGCQAKCAFCFSKASISSDQVSSRPRWDRIAAWLDKARVRGAERAVITGGGEPTLLPPAQLEQLVASCASRFSKVVLISNGHALAMASEGERIARLSALHNAGLRVLALSRHHFDGLQSERIMKLRTPVDELIRTWREQLHRWPALKLRLVCVLQQGGVEDENAAENYLTWAADQDVDEICFKELYVSTSTGSVYFDRAANDWSRKHQVPLSLVTAMADRHGFPVEHRLPWGAPVFRGEWAGKPLRIAAYTEPSLFWERIHGIARSWNVMADGCCHVSLEDRASEITLEDLK